MKKKLSDWLETFYFECDCLSDEHLLKFVLMSDSYKKDEIPELSTSVYLNQYRRWYKRFWVGLKYIFGYKSKYGEWDCWNLVPEQAEKMIVMLNKYIELRDKYDQNSNT